MWLSQTAIAKELGVSKSTISGWLRLRNNYDTSAVSEQQADSFKSCTSGWTTPRYLVFCQSVEKFRPPDGITFPLIIVDHPDVTVDRSAISKIVKNIDTDKIHNLFYEAHKEVDKIAEMFDIDEQTAWAILLEGKNNLERLGELIKQEQEAGRLATKGRPNKCDTSVTFLKDIGLTPKDSERAQKVFEHQDLIPVGRCQGVRDFKFRPDLRNS